MPINRHQKIIDTITQWFETTVTIISAGHQPVRVRIKASENNQQHEAQRRKRASTGKRFRHE